MDAKERERILIEAVFSNGPNPFRPTVPRGHVLQECIESTQDALAELNHWLGSLKEWEANGGREDSAGDFDRAFRRLANEGLDAWADGNPAGGGLDALAEVVKGEIPSVCGGCPVLNNPAACHRCTTSRGRT